MCEVCGVGGPLEHHHRKNRSAGGLWEPSNIIALCCSCHRRVTVNPKWGCDNGLHVPAWKDAASVGVLTYGRLWVALLPNGQTERLATITGSK
ncbi:MAG: HNH endonuclease signature motif containing protein [Fluviibacter sp.]